MKEKQVNRTRLPVSFSLPLGMQEDMDADAKKFRVNRSIIAEWAYVTWKQKKERPNDGK